MAEGQLVSLSGICSRISRVYSLLRGPRLGRYAVK